MRILQLNAWSLRLSVAVGNMIDQVNPDIVSLQEVTDATVENGFFPSVREFASDINYIHCFFSPVYAMQFMSGQLEFGNAMLSKIPMLNTRTIFTHAAYKTDFTIDRDDYNIRNFQHVSYKTSKGMEFHIINHHGYLIPEHKRGNTLTLQACHQINEYAKLLEGPVIIAGDFNLQPSSESIRLFDRDFRNLSAEYGLSTTRNRHSPKTEVCDYIFVNSEIIVNDFYVSDIVASDHQGLVLDFDFSSKS